MWQGFGNSKNKFQSNIPKGASLPWNERIWNSTGSFSQGVRNGTQGQGCAQWNCQNQKSETQYGTERKANILQYV